MGRMLIVADLEDNCYATPRGLQLAAKLGQEVDIVAFTYAPLKSVSGRAAEQARVKKRLLADREKSVQERIDRYRAADQEVNLQVVWEKNIERWILKQCDGERYNVVIKTGARTETLVHTSTDWELLRKCQIPVLLVCEKRWHRTRPVMVALDLSSDVASKQALNEKLLGTAQLMAQVLEVELQIITAIEIPVLLADLDLVDPLSYARDVQASMQPQIEKLAKKFDLPAAEFFCKRGPVEKVITSRAAKVRAQIVVMGTVGRKGVKARLLGNTAEKVLRHLKTDVLAIKP